MKEAILRELEGISAHTSSLRWRIAKGDMPYSTLDNPDPMDPVILNMLRNARLILQACVEIGNRRS